MNTFNIVALELTEKTRKQFERELPVKDKIIAVLAFSEASVYSRNVRPLEGALVVTGPVVSSHIFTNAGLTRKYRGSLIQQQGTTNVVMASELLKYVFEHHKPVMEPFRQLCEDMHRGMLDFAKEQLERAL